MWFGPKNVCICAADDVCVPFFIRVKVEDILKLGSRAGYPLFNPRSRNEQQQQLQHSRLERFTAGA